jgi:hypothetical protein
MRELYRYGVEHHRDQPDLSPATCYEHWRGVLLLFDIAALTPVYCRKYRAEEYLRLCKAMTLSNWLKKH